MGNDGGSIPKRRELVKEAAQKPTTTQIKETQQEQQEYHWTTCPLSHEPLKPPIVSDSSGKLFNKDAIIEFLLPEGAGTPGMSKSDNEEVLEGRVRSLRDVVEVTFKVEDVSEVAENSRNLRWVCPITNKALGPGVKAVYLVPCGHTFSESVVKEMSGDKCLQCDEPYLPDNVIAILPTSTADKERLASRSQQLKDQGLTHSLKKVSGSGKKRKKNTNTEATEAGETNSAASKPPAKEPRDALSKTGLATTIITKPSLISRSTSIKNPLTASITAKVLAEEQERNKRRKLEPNENIKSLFTNGKEKHKDGDFMTRGFSIPVGAKYT